MASIQAFADRWHTMMTDQAVWKGAIELTAERLVEVNKKQLLEGKDNTGVELPYYKRFQLPNGEFYDEYKKRINPLNGGRYDMRDSGESFKTMIGRFEGDMFRITGSGFAAAYNRGSIKFAPRLRGRIYGIYENDHMAYYRKMYLFPLVVQLIKAYMNI